MFSIQADDQTRWRALSETVRMVRLHRGMSVGEAAEAMGLPRRSYQYFEAGEGRPNLDQLFLFSDVTNSDPIGVLAAILLAVPALAVRSSDNKFMTILFIAIQAFNDRGEKQIAELRAQEFIGVFKEMFDSLLDGALQRTTDQATLISKPPWDLRQRSAPAEPSDGAIEDADDRGDESV